MATNEILNVILRLTTGDYKKQAAEAASATSKIGDSAVKASGGVGSLANKAAAFGSVLKGMAVAAAGAAVAKFAVDSIKAASALEESMNAVNVVFDTSAKTITDFGEQAAESAGLAQSEFQQMATVLGSALKNAGMDADEMADRTIELTQRAADMASVFNTTVPDALGAIQSALRGESDPIEKFGVSLSAIAVDAEAAALGFQKVGGQFTAQAKTAARLSLILKQTDQVAGDFANTSDGLANKSRILSARWTNMQAEVGQRLAPALTKLLGVAEDLLPTFESIATAIADIVGWAGELASIAAESGVELEQFGLHLESVPEVAAELDRIMLAERLAEIRDVMADTDILSWSEDMRDAATDADALADRLPVAAEGIKKVGDRAGPAAKAVRLMADSYAGLTSRMLEVTDPTFAAVAAMQRLDEAQQDPETSALDLAAAVIEAQAALTALADSNIERSIDIIAAALRISNEEARALLETAGLLSGTEIPILIEFDYRFGNIPEGLGISPEAGRAAQAAAAAALNEALVSGTGTALRQHGGPLWARQPAIIGERGPELFIPQQAGMVIPNSELQKMGTKTVTINVASPMSDFRSDLQYATLLASVTNLVEAG